MNKIVEDLDKQIDVDKEIIALLPKNEIKELKNLISKISEVKEGYDNLKDTIYKEICKRYNKYLEVNENPEIKELEEKINELNKKINLVNTESAYEKLGLDKLEYNMNGYYKKSLTELNSELIEFIKKYKNIGIEIEAKDFDISEYCQEYMTELLKSMDNSNSTNIERTFETIYWKCPELLSHIYVNIRTIYDKHKNKIEKYFKDKKDELEQRYNFTENTLENQKSELIKEKERLENIDGSIIINKFLNSELSINDYKKDNYINLYKDLILKDFEKLEENDKKELDENFAKLNRNLNEYFKYLQQKYLVDEILKIRSEELEKLEKQAKDKKKTKPESELIENEIKKKISEIEKSNQKVDKKIFKRNVEETILNRNQNILELKSLYLKLDSTSLKEKIVKEITNTSSLLDVLKFASYNYEFLAKSIIKKESDITDGEIQNKIKEIREFIKNTNFEVINNIGISDEKPVDLTIKDMYKLFGINLQKENFQEDNIEDIIKRVNIICGYNNIQNSPYTVENIEYILKAKALQK